jgi:choline dehydrogenase-like flavoprotein
VDTVLPWGQRRFGERLRLIADCRTERVLVEDGRARGVACRLRDGHPLTVSAETVVLAAGPVDSSKLLRASRLGGRRVGRGISATLSAGVIADFPDVLDADLGVQLGVYAGERPDGFVVTTDWEPLPLQAMLMPGWFSEHVANMRRYRHMTSGNALVSIDCRGEVQRGTCVVSPSEDDLRRLGMRLAVLGRAYLAAGARRVMPAALSEHSYHDPAAFEADLPGLLELDVLRRVRPQGGNAISADPAKGPVDPGFRLRGTANLYVCDASVFPTAVTVAPSLAALTLAEYAATVID